MADHEQSDTNPVMTETPPPDSLNQLSFRYVKHEDRLLLCIGTKGRKEFRIWITRRVATMLWPVLIKGMEHQVPAQAAPGPARKAVMAFQQEQASKQADFKRKYDSEGLEPVLESPLLPVNVRWGLRKNGSAILTFEGQDELAIPITLSPVLLHNFARVFSSAVNKVDWGVEFNLPTQLQTSDAPTGQIH